MDGLREIPVSGWIISGDGSRGAAASDIVAPRRATCLRPGDADLPLHC